jgi:4-hydroxy-2-oxoheptanedioate aldolase
MTNRLKALWAEGKATTNGWLMVPHVVVAEVMAGLGWDSVTLDMQHGFIDLPDIVNLLAALGSNGAAGPVPLVRVPWNDPGMIYRALDAGAQGIICPMVNTAAEAKAFVAATKYPPLGERSFGPVRMLLREGPQYVAKANATCLAIAQIETRQALENLDPILSVQGLDAIYVGPSDLAFDMGFPPHLDTEQATLLETYDRIVAAARKHGVATAMHNTTPGYATKMAAKGFNMVTFGSDVGFMLAAGQAAMATFRGHGGTGAGHGY